MCPVVDIVQDVALPNKDIPNEKKTDEGKGWTSEGAKNVAVKAVLWFKSAHRPKVLSKPCVIGALFVLQRPCVCQVGRKLGGHPAAKHIDLRKSANVRLN